MRKIVNYRLKLLMNKGVGIGGGFMIVIKDVVGDIV